MQPPSQITSIPINMPHLLLAQNANKWAIISSTCLGSLKERYHTNGIEGFWSQSKRGIIGIYHFVSNYRKF